MSVFSDYQDKANASDDRAWLGKLLWYGVAETTVPYADLAAQLASAGLERFTPAAPDDSDVFRRVFYNGQRRKLATDNPEIFENLLVREVVRAEGRVVKRIVIETVNSADVSLGFREATDIVFDATKPEEVQVTPMGGMDSARGWDLANELSAEYQSLRGCVDARAVREIVRTVLGAAMATSVRPGGGVYFVPMAQAELLQSLEDVADRLPGCHVHSLPLVSEEKQVDLVRKAYEAESIDAVDKAMDEIANLLRSDTKVTMARFSKYAARYKGLVERTKEYSSVLQQSLDTTDDRLMILGKQVSALMSRMET